jgi:hypothetical protein
MQVLKGPRRVAWRFIARGPRRGEKSSPIGTAELLVKTTAIISRPEWDEQILIVHPVPADESPGYFQAPLWGSSTEQDKQFKIEDTRKGGS